MNFLRRISTRRLLSICALALVIVIGGTTVALATSGSDPKPPAKPLADAVHDALTAPAVPGISADIHFTNNLIDASSLGRVALMRSTVAMTFAPGCLKISRMTPCLPF